jgi:DNA-binding MarR family transcriptional regulator
MEQWAYIRHLAYLPDDILDAMTPENALPESGLMLLVPRLARQILRRSSPELLGMDVRPLLALSYLAERDGAPQQELDDVLCMDARNVVVLLNELEDLGHIIRRRDPADRRRHRVHLTSSGRQALKRAAHAQRNVEEDLLQTLSDDERAILWRLTARVLRGAEPHNAPVSSEPGRPTRSSATLT